MWWTLVAKDMRAAPGLFATGFTFHQHPHPPAETGNFVLLTGNDVAQLFDRAGKMGNLFFQSLHHVLLGCAT
jgi:hypothetical protein